MSETKIKRIEGPVGIFPGMTIGELVGGKQVYEARVGGDLYVVVANEDFPYENFSTLIASLSKSDEEVSITEVKNKPLVIYKIDKILAK